ncbi:MAG: hypothetical protein LDLANPLL_00749 [Turneriella sp.]|nr:hypothetical protein [Turneriella sp.]
MSVAELKNELHEGIENLQDMQLLHIIKSIIEQQYKSMSSITLSGRRREQLEAARREAAEQLTLSSDESDQEIDTWLQP